MVCAGIQKSRVVMWQYLDGKWNGDAAEDVYRTAIAKVLRRLAPTKAKPLILEDNDPVGYKSSKAVRAKKELGFRVMSLPRYSPDLNPLDFFLWKDIEGRMTESAPKSRKEALDEFKMRLRKTAFATSRVLIAKAVGAMKKRIAAVYAAKGGHITMD